MVALRQQQVAAIDYATYFSAAEMNGTADKPVYYIFTK